MKFLIPILLFTAACSQTPSKQNVKLEEVKISQNEVNSCLEYQKNVLDEAYRRKEGSAIEFTRDPKKARELLSKFDMDKGLTKKKSKLVQNILKKCDPELVKKFVEDFKTLGACNTTFSELNFFQGLAEGLRKYPWPTDLKLEGKKVALDYVRYFSEGHYPLLNRLVALSVLDELSVNKIVDEDLHQDIKKLMQDSQIFVENLKSKVNKDPTLTCDSLTVIRDELNYSDGLKAKIKEFLARI